jgi:sugar phosphate isomerase/epimerase
MAYPEVMKGEGPILETLTKVLEDEYFGAIEVTWIKDDAVRAKAAEMLKLAHMDVIFAGQPPLLIGKLDLNAKDEAERKKAVAQCNSNIDQAYELGASIIALLSGPDPGDADRLAATERLSESLCEICKYAESQSKSKPLTVSLETFDRTIDKKCLIGPTNEAIILAKAVKAECQNFGLTVDLSHQPLLNEPISHMLAKSSDHLVHVHIGNCVMSDASHPAYGDAHPAFGCEGGENDVDEVVDFLRGLMDIGYFKKSLPTSMPVISFEVKPLPGESSDIVVAGAKRVLNEAWARV